MRTLAKPVYKYEVITWSGQLGQSFLLKCRCLLLVVVVQGACSFDSFSWVLLCWVVCHFGLKGELVVVIEGDI